MSAVKLVTAVPGPKSQALMERRKKVVSVGVAAGKSGIFAASASGSTITDVDGNRFIDFTGGIGCINAGHSDPAVVAAITAQAKLLQHTCFQVAGYESYVALCEKLVAITPVRGPRKAALFNSGAEAVENAVKIARKATGRDGIVCFENAFHGRTLLALSLTSKVKPYKEGFGPFAPSVYQAPFPYAFRRPVGLSEEAYTDECIARLKAFFKATAAPEETAAVILEPVLGEGGFIVPPRKFMEFVQKLCRDTGMLLIADEIQTGFCRTGRMFASEHYGWEPDLMTLAKSMSGGMPVSAVVGRADVMDAVQVGGLGGTFGGNPVAAAAALATIELYETKKLAARAEAIGAKVMERARGWQSRCKAIGEVRGLGAMVALEMVKNGRDPDKDTAEKIVALAATKGLLLLTAGIEGNNLRTLMPLVITDEELDEALKLFESAVTEVCS